MNLGGKNKIITEILKESAEKQGVKAFIVGGVVRDLILNKEIKDIDFLIEGSAIDFVQKAGFKIKSVHEPFNTAKVEIKGDEIDIASTRVETYPKEGILPVVVETGVPVAIDLKRRDFTVNSIAMDISTNELVDPYDGCGDIQKKVLKILHDKSFKDDPTRILRGLDFKYRFNFDFELNTKKLIKETVETFNNEALSIDRIYLTLNKIFSSNSASEILKDILSENIYKIWMKRTDLKPEQVESLQKASLIFDVKEKNKLFISALESIMMVKAPLKDNYEIYEFFKKFNEVQLALYYFKTGDENAVKYLKIKDIKPLITGKDLIENGFLEGKIIGEILSLITKEKLLNGSLNSFEDEMNFALKMKGNL